MDYFSDKKSYFFLILEKEEKWYSLHLKTTEFPHV